MARVAVGGGAVPQRVETVVIGAGQAGLAVGYHLSRAGRTFVVLEANDRVGGAWRARWDSLRLFTPARYDGLPGMRFPAPPAYFPTKDEMADYLESYVERHRLPVRTGVRVERVAREGDRYLVESSACSYLAENVVLATASYQLPRVPEFAAELADRMVQLHSSAYRNPGALLPGPVLVVGAGNSGSEIARELARTHETYLAGNGTGELPFRIETRLAQAVLVPLVLRFLFHRVLMVDTPIGRKLRPRVLSRGGPWIRVKAGDLVEAGVGRVPRVTGVRDGLPLLEDGTTLDVANVIWCTGFLPDFTSLDLPLEGDAHGPRHQMGAVPDLPGLFFTGLHFQYALSSAMIHGVGRDAARVAKRIVARGLAEPGGRRTQSPSREPQAAEADAGSLRGSG